jgi:uncharacterized lipoprotein YddW (UPF0748 family)
MVDDAVSQARKHGIKVIAWRASRRWTDERSGLDGIGQWPLLTGLDL